MLAGTSPEGLWNAAQLGFYHKFGPFEAAQCQTLAVSKQPCAA